MSTAEGVAHAFDSRAAADRFGAQQLPKIKAMAPRHSFGPLPTTCGAAYNISRMYDYSNCGGTNFAFLLTESDASFGNVGWNNKGNSLVVGYTGSGCTILIRLYPGVNYTYTVARFYGSPWSGYYLFNSAQQNNFESGKSTCS